MICSVPNLIRLSFLFQVLRALILLLNRCVCRGPILCSFVFFQFFFVFFCVLVYDFIINKYRPRVYGV